MHRDPARCRKKSPAVVRARAAHPAWASGMMRHGFRGRRTELTMTLDNLAAFAHLTRDVPHHLFDLYTTRPWPVRSGGFHGARKPGGARRYAGKVRRIA